MVAVVLPRSILLRGPGQTEVAVAPVPEAARPPLTAAVTTALICAPAMAASLAAAAVLLSTPSPGTVVMPVVEAALVMTAEVNDLGWAEMASSLFSTKSLFNF